ncbi:hypothetical protein LINGRAHAP2_LOCUS5222 [Linum grandiflorum]
MLDTRKYKSLGRRQHFPERQTELPQQISPTMKIQVGWVILDRGQENYVFLSSWRERGFKVLVTLLHHPLQPTHRPPCLQTVGIP